MRKVAILGTASSWSMYPKDWEVWACSPGLFKAGVKATRWFEIHNPMEVAELYPDYFEFLVESDCPVYCLHEEAPYPKKEMVNASVIRETFGDWCLQSSISWMLAQALWEGVDEVGVWGVDMSTDGEYGQQKAGCLHLLSLARLQGVKVTVPVGSELRTNAIPYPFSFEQEPGRTLVNRLKEVESHLGKINAQITEATEVKYNLEGRREEILRTLRILNMR